MEEMWLKLKESPKWSKWPVVKREEIPIREILDVVNASIARPEIAELKNGQEMLTTLKFRHAKSGFYSFCFCDDCIEYREMVLQLLADHSKSTNMWNILKALTREFYLPIIKTAPSVVAEVYEKITKENEPYWQMNGVINRTKVQHLEFVSDLFLTDNMIILLYSTLLFVDDAHQLFELMSYQVKCFARAYAEGITATISDTERGAEDTINYVLDGYEHLCKVAGKIGSYLFAFENKHLEKFSLSWMLLNKQMYQKWVYSAFSEQALQCILQLRIEVPMNRYIDIVKRYINFDNEMIAVNEECIHIRKALNKYHNSYDDQQRRHRIRALKNLFEAIHNDLYVPVHKLIDEPDWDTYTDRQVVWQNVVAYIKKRWSPVETIQDERRSCGESLDCHAMSCECITCFIIGGPTSKPFSVTWTNFKSTFAKQIEEKEKQRISIYMKNANVLSLHNEENVINTNNPSGVINRSIDTDGSYHISWAVFKHLKDRKCYTYQTLDRSYFCQNCTREECAVAKKIINNELMIGLANILLKYYRPFSLSSEEINEMTPNVMYYYRKVIAMDLLPIVQNDDIVVNTFWTFFHSIFARYIVDVETDSSQINLQHFELTNTDIKLNTSYIDNSPRNTLLEYILKLEFVSGRDMSSKSPELVASCRADLLNCSTWNHDDLLGSANCSKDDFLHISLHKEASTHKNCDEIMDKIENTCKILTTNTKKLAKSKKVQTKNIMVKEVNKVEPKVVDELEITHKFSINKKNTKQINGKQNITLEKNKFTNVDNWIKETLSFIEGCDKIKCGNKKAEKKARQKLKKEESKRIEELYELRSQYLDLYFKEFTSKHELKDHKLAKRKNKKKIAELETNIKRLNTAKTKIESGILELLALVKSINIEFKFSYLPTREQQQEFLKKGACQNDQENKKCAELTEISMANHDVVVPKAASTINLHPAQQFNDYVTDPSKRIVTIRRINLPDVSEPQVTVTAKGASPDKDKLLYTFINGQLVPATALDSLTLNILRPVVPKINKFTKPLTKQDIQLCNGDKKNVLIEPASKTKTQIKKERKRVKSLKIQELDNSLLSNPIYEKNGKQKNKRIQNSFKANNENLSLFNSGVILPSETKPLANVRKLVNDITNHECSIKPNVNVKIPAAVSGRKARKQNSAKEPTNKNMFINNKFNLLHFDEYSSCEDVELTSTLKDDAKPGKYEKLNPKISNKCLETNIKKKKCKVQKSTLPVNNINIENFKNPKETQKNVKKGRQNLQIDKTAINAENIVKSLHNSMQKLNLNADTTIEIAKHETTQESAIMHLNISIMEQINKGVQVEKLTLPPGITLTKVDPIKAEALRVQRESIGKLSKPMQNQFINSRSSNPTDIENAHQQSGIIMVDAMNSKPPAKSTMSNVKTTSRNTRKSKKNAKIDSSKTTSQKLNEPKMITLRNPMFHGANIQDFPVQVSGCMQMSTLPMDQPAAIIKNDNGMFTIRNPALHQAFSNSLQSNSRQYSPYCYLSNSGNDENNSHTIDSSSRDSNFVSNYLNNDKCLPAIGSEIKSCTQHKTLWHVQGDNTYRSESIQFQQPSCYNTDRCLPTSSACESSIYNTVHECDDSPPPKTSSLNHYLDGIPHNSKFGNKYDDLTFLKTLMPGQRLNSEVTIHNINESKFSNKTATTLPHGVEITPVSSLTQKMSSANETATTIQSLEKIGEYGDNLFAPNQTLDLSEMESDERDIETFKRFSYEFEPPKYKPKVHINVNDLLVNNKNLQSTRPSPYIERSMEGLVHDINSLNISTETSQVNTCFSEKHNSSCNNCW